MREPIRLRFFAADEGVARIVVGEVSKAGGILQLALNGNQVATKEWPAESADHVVDQEFLAPFGKGANELIIDNAGTDWFKLKSVTIPRIGSGVLAACTSSSRYSLMRLQWLGGLGGQVKTLLIPGLDDGLYEMRQFDVLTGTEKDSSVLSMNGQISRYEPCSTDEGVALIQRRTATRAGVSWLATSEFPSLCLIGR